MVKVKGCNMFPAQIEEVINFTEGTSSEYQMMIEAITAAATLSHPVRDCTYGRGSREVRARA